MKTTVVRFGKTMRLAVAGVALGLAVAGCSTVSSRVDRNKDEFASWPEPVREKVLAGDIDIGFTAPQVRMAMGDPSQVSTRKTGDGTSEVWSYGDRRSRFTFGVGFGGMIGSNSSLGVGVNTSTGSYHRGAAMRVVFEDGRVSSIEEVKRQ